MTRGTNATLLAELQLERAQIVEFLDIETGLASPSHLYFTTWSVPVTWNGQLWTPKRFSTPQHRIENQGEAGGGVLEVADEDAALSAYVAAGMTLEMKTVIHYWTTIERVEAGSTAEESEELVCTQIERVEGALRLHVGNIFAIAGGVDTPLRILTHTDYPGLAISP